MPDLATTRLAAVAMALADLGIEPVPAPYSDELADAVTNQLKPLDGVLVWVNPIENGRDRKVLDEMLRQVAGAGVFVSAHPDLIDAIGTKEVLYRTRDMPWGSDVRLYSTLVEFRDRFPECLAEGRPRVIKQCRGNGGNGVWKVETAGAGLVGQGTLPASTPVHLRHAQRGSVDELSTLGAFMERSAVYFEDGGCLVDQLYQPRLTEGMVRCYLAGERVVGFGEQKVNALFPALPGTLSPQPDARSYYPPTRPDLQSLKRQLENEWLPELRRRFELNASDLPIIWDADLLHGPPSATGSDTWVLCEMNVSCVFPFPDEALIPLAQLLRTRIEAR